MTLYYRTLEYYLLYVYNKFLEFKCKNILHYIFFYFYFVNVMTLTYTYICSECGTKKSSSKKNKEKSRILFLKILIAKYDVCLDNYNDLQIPNLQVNFCLTLQNCCRLYFEKQNKRIWMVGLSNLGRCV